MGLRRGLQLARVGSRILRRMRGGRRAVETHLSGRPGAGVPMPTFVQLRLTNLCNLRCKMCGQWGDTGIYRSLSSAPATTEGESEKSRIRELLGLGRQLTLAEYGTLLDQIAPFDPVVSLFGGEPLLYPDVVPLVREIKRRGLALTMITNGSRLEAVARDLVEAGIDVISVSVDGTPDVHDAIRGADGSFERIAAGLRAVAGWRRKLGRAAPMTVAIFPVTELNMDQIRPGIEALQALPVDTVNLGLRWFVPTDAGREYQRVMKEEFGVEATSWTGFEFSWPGGADAARTPRMAQLVKLLEAIRRRRLLDEVKGRPWTSFVPDVAPRDVPAYFTEPGRTFGHDLCPVAWYFAQVEPDGDVCFCGDFPDYVIGNVRRESFRDVWTSDRATRFREKLAREPLPICARCCGSYVYGRFARPAAR